MILGNLNIRSHIPALVEGIDNPSQIGPASVDLRLGTTFLLPRYVRENVELGSAVPYGRREIEKDGSFLLFPEEFVLATTMEKIVLPNNIAAFVQGRSSIGRIGLTTQNAGFVDPGFHGHITLELVNESKNTLVLRPGYRVVQVVFFQCHGVGDGYEGKYNGQVEATGSRMHLDWEVQK